MGNLVITKQLASEASKYEEDLQQSDLSTFKNNIINKYKMQ